MADHLRRPLYLIEKVAVPTKVCVTGASGYVAASVIARLLAAGHTVHGTVPDLSSQHRFAHLLELPGAQRLHMYGARLQHSGTFDHAVAGCDYVIHLASPVGYLTGSIPDGEALVRMEVAGVENVLAAVEKAGTVKKVVVMSSAGAVTGDPSRRVAGHRYTEADWDLSTSPHLLPSFRAKSLAERRAYEMSREKAWQLCTICPTLIQGPSLGPLRCESTDLMARLLKGNSCCFPSLGLAVVDVDDVAAAACLALFQPNASGRYLVSAMNMNLSQYVDVLRPEYHDFPLPRFCMPTFCTSLALRSLGDYEVGFTADVVKALQGRVPFYDSSRSMDELGLKHFPVRRTAQDMADAVISLGFVKERRK